MSKLPDYLERMVQELSNLEAMITRASSYYESHRDDYLLGLQIEHMTSYSGVLKARINRAMDPSMKEDS